ncbi:predicted protein [Chaetoceros tenuissimus]|uniref:Uncharacterized protein n=1 Tax=Chaetoceros tenuissimus TaxID=426638 RepID=A0AAD3GYK0_9STRA|nr:predicted protein [Chaetoceros tenuissimus]
MCSQCESAKTSEIVAILFNIAAVHKAIGESDKALDAFLKVLHHERDLHQREGSTFDAKDLILTLMHIFEIYDREFGIPRDGMEYLLEAATLCREYNKSIDNTLGRYVFFLLGDVLSSNQETTEGFKCYCEGCKLFGTMDTDDILAFGKKGVHMILAQMCNDNRVFPVHAAAA